MDIQGTHAKLDELSEVKAEIEAYTKAMCILHEKLGERYGTKLYRSAYQAANALFDCAMEVQKCEAKLQNAFADLDD